uniref:AAA+ ATPase domain-containing protein n=1 Tax=Eucampia antarctica TaxID=49252 RepID=A0A7S2VYE9_9STRA|mmetsp:Transcript_10813/g.10318  ORF Transcript_10813/g.10318 Transcript_10813/m.10318 type:complete len:408 (+) Transcript_10813:64-1287(+)|eukprot:CAMPEP_0197836380 /NCGR_PEP_ID=MMETSP1437-20131217/28766_1 /TAXON_ID=49252 ORGANISM="Eucampia antarctica, Strain CCMP1452" /NCGR_SAMPLE_ID=MMETSP1437 /ASSEMBLY_ACC=CAM_ASM_001096 /LENGTH=407 /DNA_ID=CAMNT_0043442507 /DNA_START=45 /DNA_END=1268 /DNA_ORIENTATION=+
MKLTAAITAVCFASASAFAPAITSQSSTSLYAGTPAFTGPSLDYTGGDDPNSSNYVKLSDALNDADIDRRKAQEAADAREHATQRRREERQKKIDYMVQMPDNTPAGTVDDFMFKEGVQSQLDKLDEDLVGLVPVKKRVKEIAALLVLDKMRRKLGFETSVPSLHLSFTGAPGTGKTTVAVRMGQILAKMGYSRRGHVVLATRDDLVGQYVGHTAPKTKEMIKKAMGGVLLVDEAYYLYNAANDRDYGQESIEILLNVMENNQDDLVVAVAGYKDRMDKFFSYIPGMASRIGNHIDFPDYSADELVEISMVMSRELEYDIHPNAYPVFKNYVEKRMELPFFSNARTVRNAMDRARMNAAIRTFEKFAIQGVNGGFCSIQDLKEISPEDFQVLLDDILYADTDKRIFA